MIGNNSGDSSAEKLRRFIERLERLDEEIRALNADKSDVYAEAKGTGFDVPTMRQVLKLRRMEPDVRREKEEMLDLYERSLGMRV